jgi:hypothetical protein
MSLKGFPSQKQIKKELSGISDEVAIPGCEFVTVQPRGSDRYSLDTQSHGFYQVSASNVISAATTRTITKNAHGARKGDIIRFTSGALIGLEVVVSGIFSANVMVIGTILDTVPSALDEYTLLRPVSMLLTQDGAVPVTLVGGATEATQLLVKADLDALVLSNARLDSIGYVAVDFNLVNLTGGAFTTIFTVPVGKTAYNMEIVHNGGSDFKVSQNGGAAVSCIPAGEKAVMDIILNAGETFGIDTISGDNVTSGKLFINFFGV